MYSSARQNGELRDCRRFARAVISASYISSLKHVQTLKRIDESMENMRKKLASRDAPTDSSVSTPRVNVIPIIRAPPKRKPEPQPVRPKNWSPITDGKKAIIAMIDQLKMWAVPYAPCQYVVQFICTVSLCALQRHKYCVRWQNGRRSAMFYVNIDETERETSVWVCFPGEVKAHRPHTSSAHFHRFLHRNLFF